MHDEGTLYWIKNATLFALFIGFWTTWTLLVRSSKYEAEETGFKYDTTTVVLLTEVAKLLLTILMHFAPKNVSSYPAEVSNVLEKRNMGIYFAVPAFLYMIYNWLSFVNLNLFDPASFKVLINMRILFSAVLFQLFFSRSLGWTKWVALVLLMIGCAVNQIEGDLNLTASIYSIGFVALQAFTSSLAGVYSEVLLKKDVDISMNIKNMYLYWFSIVFNFVYMVVMKPTVFESFFEGYRPKTFLIIFIGAFCGFSTALFLRHLNILLKEYAHSGEMFITAFLSSALFGEQLDARIIVSMLLVSISLALYNRKRDFVGECINPPEEAPKEMMEVV